VLLFEGNTVLTLNTYKDVEKEIFCKSKSTIDDRRTTNDVLFNLGCYQDKLHPHERNRKELENQFNKQPGGGANPSTA
jgi:hypothetical protein